MSADPATHRPGRYVVAVVATFVALGFRLVLGPELVASVHVAPFGAALISAWYGGLGPGLLSLAISLVGGTYLFLPLTPTSAIRDALFTFFGTLLVYVTATLTERQRRIISERTVELQSALTTLGESEERFRQAFECAPIGMVLAGLDGRLHQVNSALCDMLGYTPQALCQLQISAILHPDDVAGSLEARARLLSGELRTVCAERRFMHSDGQVVWCQVSMSLLRDAGGQPRELIGELEDVSARKRIEVELRDSEAKFRGLAESASAAIFIHRDGALCYVNAEAEAITGYSRDELQVTPFRSLVHPDSQGLLDERRAARQRGDFSPARYEIRILRKDRTARWVDFTSVIIQYEGARAVLGTAFDITERKRAEEAVRERDAELAHVLRLSTLGEMATGLAHEINQPLAAIVNYARGCGRRLDAEGITTEGVRDTVEQIATEALRAAEVIRRLRRLVRKELPRREPVDLNGLVHDASRLMEREAREMGARLSVQVEPTPVEILADEVQIEQVILNLLRNSLEAIREVESGARELSVSVNRRLGLVEVSVSDSGGGLPSADAEQLFDAFYTTKQGGLGMGLTISRSIIEAHGGQLWASPLPERGAIVRFTLPSAEQVRDYVH